MNEEVDDHQELVDTTTAARILDVPAHRIRAWRSRGQVQAAGGTRGPGRTRTSPLYRLSELQPLAVRYHEETRRVD